MSFALYRAAKLKSIGAMRGSMSHTARRRETPNADPTRFGDNKQLIGFGGQIPSPDAFVDAWTRMTRGVLRKPDAVLCQELFLGVSPEYFSQASNDGDRAHRLETWKSRAVVWLRDEFGDLVFSATLHVDEATPHICAYVVPIRAAKDGTRWLAAKHWFSRSTLRKQQDTYAAVLADLGIHRGLRGSKAKHQSVRQFYARIAEAKQGAPAADEIADVVRGCIPEKGLLERSDVYRDRVAQVVAGEVAHLVGIAEQSEAVATNAQLAKAAQAGIAATNRSLSRQLSDAQSKLKELTNQVRDIPLEDVMQRLGFGDPVTEGGERVWRTGEHALSVHGPKWYDHKAAKGGGKAIDLVMHVMACDFREAVGWLAGQWSESEATAAVRCAAVEQVRETPKKDFRELWRYYAEQDAQATRLAHAYLVEERLLPDPIVRQAIASGLVHGSFERRRNGVQRTWCVFPHRSASGQVVGASLRATDSLEGPKRAIGSKTAGFFAIGPAPSAASELVLVESPVDAMSYYALQPQAHVVSIAGSAVPDALLPVLAASSKPVVVALDADEAGHQGWSRLLERVKSIGGGLMQRLKRLVPSFPGWPCKDWNDVRKAKVYEATAAAPKDSPSVVRTHSAARK